MNVAYFDCFAGISGDMILGALIDLGFPISKLKDSLESLPLTNYKLAFFQEKRMEIKGTRFRIHMDTPETTWRTFKDIRAMIEVSKLLCKGEKHQDIPVPGEIRSPYPPKKY